MANIQIAVINATSDGVLSDADAAPVVDALQTQVRSDFGPVWGVDADLTFVPRGGNPPGGSWWLSLLDSSDQANALGYHDLTSDGLPLGKAFVKTDMDEGLNWSVTVSHELLEMLVDPDINLWAFPKPDQTAGRLYAYEVCDPCEADELGYTIGSALVSDFVYPAWFEEFWSPGSTQFDKQGQIQQPFAILQGGYALVYDIDSGTGYHQVFGKVLPRHVPGQLRPWELNYRPTRRPRLGSRRERRMTQRQHWVRSSVHVQCGTERWLIKTLGDPDVSKIKFDVPVASSVKHLTGLPSPVHHGQSGPANQRLGPVELTVYTVTAALVGSKLETDNDVHLVIADPTDPSATMIAEFPRRECARTHDKNLLNRMDAARTAVLGAVPPLVQRMAMGAPVPPEAVDPQTGKRRLTPMHGSAQITGVGFFDRLHGQDGVAPNAIELHPVLDFKMLH